MDEVADYIVGIDLHGTLLNKQEFFPSTLAEEMRKAMQAVKPRASLFTCTGNDLLFVKEKLASIFDLFEGHVLETGTVISEDGVNEKLITKEEEQELIKEFKRKVEERAFPEVTEGNRRRLTTLSLFCKDPKGFHSTVQEFVNELGWSEKLSVVFSSVAVDIIPAGYNKFAGLNSVANGMKTIGIADSQNDVPLLTFSDYACVPSNAHPVLLEYLRSKGKEIVPVAEAEALEKNKVLIASKPEAFGVAEILKRLSEIV